MRRRSKEAEVPAGAELVRDSHGVPVGIRVHTAGAVDDSPQARHLRRLDGLRKTRELDGQYRLRCQVSLFCGDPPR